MRWWLKGYEEAIAALGNTVVISPVAQGEQRAAIAPMLKTTWDQEPVYNQDCPVYNGTVEKYKGKAEQGQRVSGTSHAAALLHWSGRHADGLRQHHQRHA